MTSQIRPPPRPEPFVMPPARLTVRQYLDVRVVVGPAEGTRPFAEATPVAGRPCIKPPARDAPR